MGSADQQPPAHHVTRLADAQLRARVAALVQPRDQTEERPHVTAPLEATWILHQQHERERGKLPYPRDLLQPGKLRVFARNLAHLPVECVDLLVRPEDHAQDRLERAPQLGRDLAPRTQCKALRRRAPDPGTCGLNRGANVVDQLRADADHLVSRAQQLQVLLRMCAPVSDRAKQLGIGTPLPRHEAGVPAVVLAALVGIHARRVADDHFMTEPLDLARDPWRVRSRLEHDPARLAFREVARDRSCSGADDRLSDHLGTRIDLAGSALPIPNVQTNGYLRESSREHGQPPGIGALGPVNGHPWRAKYRYAATGQEVGLLISTPRPPRPPREIVVAVSVLLRLLRVLRALRVRSSLPSPFSSAYSAPSA